MTLSEAMHITRYDPTYGEDGTYCWVLDPDDGGWYFLKRPDDAVIGQAMEYGEIRTRWPENCSDGEVLYVGDICNRYYAVEFTEELFKVLDINFL